MIAELRVERRKLADLKPHPRNPRVHAERDSAEWDALERSLAHDYFDPLVLNVRNGMLVSGHYRQKVMEVMGVTEVDVVIVDYDETTHLARMMAANRQFGEWDDEAVAELVDEIEAAGGESWLAGFLEEDWEDVLDVPDDLEDDSDEVAEKLSRAEELQAKWQVQPWELFEAGGVRLLCGDCTKRESWERLLGSEVADMVWTDPPYNVNYDELQAHRNRVSARCNVPVEAIQNDDLSDDEYKALLVDAFGMAGAFVKPGGAIYIAHADLYRLENQVAAEMAGFLIKQNIVWVKSNFTLGRQDHQWQHEPILYGWKDGASHFWQGGYTQSTVEEESELDGMDRDEVLAVARHLLNDRNGTVVREGSEVAQKIGHPTVKPLPLVARQIWNSSRKGETVLELFGGSGTTLLAAHHTGRRCVATELEPKFCAVILERLEEAGLEVSRYEPETDA